MRWFACNKLCPFLPGLAPSAYPLSLLPVWPSLYSLSLHSALSMFTHTQTFCNEPAMSLQWYVRGKYRKRMPTGWDRSTIKRVKTMHINLHYSQTVVLWGSTISKDLESINMGKCNKCWQKKTIMVFSVFNFPTFISFSPFLPLCPSLPLYVLSI